MEEGTADVEALAARASQDERRGEARGGAGESDEEHETPPHVRRIDETVHA